MVLNDSVLHHSHRPVAAAMRVRIVLFRFAVGGPAGVADTALPRSPVGLNTGCEIAQLALGTTTGELALCTHRGDPGGVVAAVLQLAKAFQELGGRFSGAHQRNDSAHTKSPAEAGPSL